MQGLSMQERIAIPRYSVASLNTRLHCWRLLGVQHWPFSPNVCGLEEHTISKVINRCVWKQQSSGIKKYWEFQQEVQWSTLIMIYCKSATIANRKLVIARRVSAAVNKESWCTSGTCFDNTWGFRRVHSTGGSIVSLFVWIWLYPIGTATNSNTTPPPSLQLQLPPHTQSSP